MLQVGLVLHASRKEKYAANDTVTMRGWYAGWNAIYSGVNVECKYETNQTERERCTSIQ